MSETQKVQVLPNGPLGPSLSYGIGPGNTHPDLMSHRDLVFVWITEYL